MRSLSRDARFALRTLLARPGYTAVAVLAIALGIGATSAIFSVVNAVLIQPLPVERPGELAVPEVIGPTGFSISLSIPNFRDWRDRNRSFETFGLLMGRSRTLTGIERAEIVRTRWVLGDFFETLGIDAARGRVFRAEETFEGAEPVAVVTHSFSERLLGERDPIGQTITLDDQPFTIVGVMPPGFQFPDPRTEIYLPMGFYESQLCWEQRGCSQGSWAIGRLADGVGLEMAQQDLDRIVGDLETEVGQPVARPVLQSLSDFYVGDVRRNVWLLMGAVGFVLLIACANVASLTLARGESRRKEVALRAALGAGRSRVVRQFLTESLVLAAVGGAVGVLFAFGFVRMLVPLVADALPRLLADQIGMTAPVLVFTALSTALAGVLFGVVPALRASRSDLVGELKEGGRASAAGGNRLRSALVVAEVALSLVLLIGAGLMIQSLGQLRDVDKGFDEEGLFTAEVTLPRARYEGLDKSWAYFRELHQRVATLPGVTRASLTQILPLEGNSWEQSIYPEGVPTDAENASSVLYYMVTPEHFDMFRIPLLEGRGFEPSDRDGAVPVAIIDETMAERFWPGEDAVGKRVTFETDDGEDDQSVRVYRTVVGVVKNVRHYELENAARITVYVPFEQTEGNWTTSMKIVAKTEGEPLALAEAVRAEVAELDPEVPLAEVETMSGYVEAAMSGSRAVSTLLSSFSAVAVVLSAIGLFGLMSFTVVQRFRDIGIRMALGASASRVITSISRQGLALTAVGVAIGLLGAVALTRLMTGLLFEVDPLDVATFSGFAVFLVAVAAAAAWIPARRATKIDPAVVLRLE